MALDIRQFKIELYHTIIKIIIRTEKVLRQDT